MADTIISNTPGSRSDNGTSGWIFALLVIVAIAVAGVVMYQNGFLNSTSDTDDTTNINVTVPDPVTPTPNPAPVE
jgi:hypothetical protein